MYRVTVITDGLEYILHDPRDDQMQLIDPKYIEQVGTNGALEFTIHPLHPNKDKIIPMASQIMVWKDQEMFFCCRMLSSESDFNNTGRAKCEGELAYLLDSVQRPYEFTGSVHDLFSQLLETHNSQVEPRKRFETGNITVTNDTEIKRSNVEYSDTMHEMLNQLTNINGGYIHVRYANRKKYLDYVTDYGGINSQTIRFGENILDLTKHVEPTSLITVLIPTGATPESADTTVEPKPIDITSVNGGKDYIFNQEAVDKYGQIWGYKKFEDVTDPEILLAKARAYLDESVAIPETIELRAVDLSLIDVDMEPLKVGYWTMIDSKPHGLKKRMMLTRKESNLADPGKGLIVLGQVRKTFTSSSVKQQTEISDRINRVAASTSKEINRKVENATQLITGGKGGYVVLDVEDPDTGKRALPWRILVMDTPDKDTAKSVIQINKNGIGFSRTGINGPYSNAWTIDGNLVADFITAGTMLADRIRGGMLEVGGSGLGRDGRIVVKDANDRQIGYWDKTGLHALLGVLSGTSIVGGSIDIGNGTFEVNSDGEVVINAGEINIGNVFISDGYTWFEGFGVGGPAFYSRDSSHSVQLYSGDWRDDPACLILSHGGRTSRLSSTSLMTGDIILTGDSWWQGWTLTEEIKLLHDAVFNN